MPTPVPLVHRRSQPIDLGDEDSLSAGRRQRRMEASDPSEEIGERERHVAQPTCRCALRDDTTPNTVRMVDESKSCPCSGMSQR